MTRLRTLFLATTLALSGTAVANTGGNTSANAGSDTSAKTGFDVATTSQSNTPTAREAGSGGEAASASTAPAEGAIMMMQRNVYVPVDEEGNLASNQLLVVERQAFIPVEETDGGQSSPNGSSDGAANGSAGNTTNGSTGGAANGSTASSGTTDAAEAPVALFILVPDTESGTTASADGERKYRVQRMDQESSGTQQSASASGEASELNWANAPSEAQAENLGATGSVTTGYKGDWRSATDGAAQADQAQDDKSATASAGGSDSSPPRQ